MAISIHTMKPTIRSTVESLLRFKRMPGELAAIILDLAYPPGHAALIDTRPRRQMPTTHPALTPPANGATPLMTLPAELRRAIFVESLPSRDKVIHPKCDDEKVYKPLFKFALANPTSNLMILNTTIRDEVAEVVYEERTFAIHVHEGLLDGGIEFLQAGRQPLHFQDSICDDRFWKFSEGEKDFGFRRLKKIRIQIFPSPEKDTRHCALNTYFTNLALVRLLHRSGEDKHRITSLTIQFMSPQRTGDEEGRHAIQRAEHYWWDPEKNQPRESSIHGISNIELVLRPFGNLTGCHAVNIDMPSQLQNYAPIAVFTRDLKASMKSRNGLMFADDDLEIKIEAARWAMEDHTFALKHGTKHREVVNLTGDDSDEEMDSDYDNDGDERKSPLGKRERSSGSKVSSRKKRSLSAERSMDEDEDIIRAVEESKQFAPGAADDEEEARQIEQAMKASLADYESQSMQMEAQRSASQMSYATAVQSTVTPAAAGQARADDANPNPSALRRLRARHFLSATARPFVPQGNQHQNAMLPRDGETAGSGRPVNNNQQVNSFHGAPALSNSSGATTLQWQPLATVQRGSFTQSTNLSASAPSYSPGGVSLGGLQTYTFAAPSHPSNYGRPASGLPSSQPTYNDSSVNDNTLDEYDPQALTQWMNDNANGINDDYMNGSDSNGASFL